MSSLAILSEKELAALPPEMISKPEDELAFSLAKAGITAEELAALPPEMISREDNHEKEPARRYVSKYRPPEITAEELAALPPEMISPADQSSPVLPPARSKYQDGKIYIIKSDKGGIRYIGSTCQPLELRMAQHRAAAKSWKHGVGNYVSSFDVLEYPDAKMWLVEKHPCETKKELLKREGYYVSKIRCVNKVMPGRS
jgi:GIY-YIG catalytic domain